MIAALLSPLVVNAGSAEILLSGEQEYKAVRLTPEIYQQASRDLSDLLILDETGTQVPYFIHSMETMKKEQTSASYPLQLINQFDKSGNTYLDYQREGNELQDVIATSLSFTTSAVMFAKNIELRGSYDGLGWETIQQDHLYRVEENEKLTIGFAAPLKYTHYRLILLDNAEKVTFDQAVLEYDQYTVNQVAFTESLIPSFVTEEEGRTTVIKVSGLKNVKISEVRFLTQAQFKRPVFFAGGQQKTLYHLTFGGSEYQDLTLPFDGYQERTDTLEIKIENGDDRPITVEQVSLTYLTDELIFPGKATGEYTLIFGDQDKAAPIYDLSSYRDLVLEEGYDHLSLTKITGELSAETPEKADYTTVFNVIVVVVALLLGFIILLHLKRTKRPSS